MSAMLDYNAFSWVYKQASKLNYNISKMPLQAREIWHYGYWLATLSNNWVSTSRHHNTTRTHTHTTVLMLFLVPNQQSSIMKLHANWYSFRVFMEPWSAFSYNFCKSLQNAHQVKRLYPKKNKPVPICCTERPPILSPVAILEPKPSQPPMPKQQQVQDI